MRKLYEGFKINDGPILLPDADIELNLEDLDSSESGRDESGVMHRIVLREKIKTWTLRYGVLTLEEYCYMLSIFSGRHTFSVTVLDEYGTPVQYEAYCAKMSAALHNQKIGIYKSLTIKIVEC